MTFGSLFAGIGGFDLGLERAGMTCKWQVEIDPFRRAVLAQHWPDVQRFSDVRTVGAHNLERVDVLAGGFPCQDLSLAGKKAGLDGPRSGLWREYFRVLDEIRPTAAIFENVHHAWRKWVPELRRQLWARGYASLPIRVRASDFGANHVRARVFLVAHVDPQCLRLECWRGGWPHWQGPLFAANDGAQGIADAQTERCEPRRPELRIDREGRRNGPQEHLSGWAIEPDVVRVVHGVSDRLERRRLAARIEGLGDAVCPPCSEWLGRRVMEAEEAAS